MREVLKADIASPSPLLILVFINYNAHMIASKQNKDLVCKGRGLVFFNISVSFHTDSIPLQNYSHNHQDVPLLKARTAVELILNMDEIRDSPLQISEPNLILRCIISLAALL